jgi:hypothetical protein
MVVDRWKEIENLTATPGSCKHYIERLFLVMKGVFEKEDGELLPIKSRKVISKLFPSKKRRGNEFAPKLLI